MSTSWPSATSSEGRMNVIQRLKAGGRTVVLHKLVDEEDRACGDPW